MLGLGINHGLTIGLPGNRAAGGGFVGPLDGYTSGLAGAWSVARRLLSSYSGPLVRVRRSTDDSELDIGSTITGVLDQVALITFVGSASAYVTMIYDQSGNGYDLKQAVAMAQQRLVNAGTVEMTGTTPAIKATADMAQGYATDTFTAYAGASLSVFMRGEVAGGAFDKSRLVSLVSNAGVDYASPGVCALQPDYSTTKISAESNGSLANADITSDVPIVVSSIFTGSQHTMTCGTSSNSVSFSSVFHTEQVLLAQYAAGSFYSASGNKTAELAIYFADKSSDASAIRGALTV